MSFQFNIEEPPPSPKLMYRRPDTDEYQNITEVLDEILQRLDAIETLLQNKAIY